eukprot:scaffold2985_cov229-Pinguiococcus_pyrenoidosus.AAC.3
MSLLVTSVSNQSVNARKRGSTSSGSASNRKDDRLGQGLSELEVGVGVQRGEETDLRHGDVRLGKRQLQGKE